MITTVLSSDCGASPQNSCTAPKISLTISFAGRSCVRSITSITSGAGTLPNTIEGAVEFYTRKKTVTSRYFSSGESGSYFVET